MDLYTLNVNSRIIGAYLSAEQIDLLSIIQCNTKEELLLFYKSCDQINHYYSNEELKKLFENNDLDSLKRLLFKDYQNSLVFHDESKNSSINNRLLNCGISKEDIEIINQMIINNGTYQSIKEYITKKYPNYAEIFKKNHHFVSEERDQIKSESLYDELLKVNEHISDFNTILVGSGRIYNVINNFYDESSPDKRYDFYHAKRDLDFAYRNNKQVRFHALLNKELDTHIFNNKSKDEILVIIKNYVKHTIDFINDYNDTHKILVGEEEIPIITSVDLFNEIISFDKNSDNEYYNIWQDKFDISLEELLEVFDYALENKPKGVTYVYNEPFLENTERRKKVFETLDKIDYLRPGLIDTLGTQMHITITEDINNIIDCFKDLKNLQDKNRKNIQITEFDLSLGRREAKRIFREKEVSLEEVYAYKEEKLSLISNVINNSGVNLEGVTYWSLTDELDHNLERIRTNSLLNKEIIDVSEIPTACGGLIPTHKKYQKYYQKKDIGEKEK